MSDDAYQMWENEAAMLRRLRARAESAEAERDNAKWQVEFLEQAGRKAHDALMAAQTERDGLRELVREAAIVGFYVGLNLDDLMEPHHASYANAVPAGVAMLTGIREVLDNPPWANGQHFGDCTKDATTCFRCLVEEHETVADAVREAVEGQG